MANNNSANASSIVSKVWAFCQTLRDDGVCYGNYLEQLTYLLFLKMADEYSKPPHNRTMPIPQEYTWETLTTKSGAIWNFSSSKAKHFKKMHLRRK